MITLKITKKGFVNQTHGHAWDLLVGMVTKALNKHKNPFHNNIDGNSKNRKTSAIRKAKK